LGTNTKKKDKEASNGGGSFTWPWQAQLEGADGSARHTLSGEQFPPSAQRMPVLLRDIVGLRVRLIRPGDVITDDYLFDRINLFEDASGRIVDIRFF